MLSQPKDKKLNKSNSLIASLGPLYFFFTMALLPTLVLVILLSFLYFKGIKTPLHDLLMNFFRSSWGIIYAFCLLFALVFCLLIVFYVFFFLVKNLKSKLDTKVAYYLFFWLSSQGLIGAITYYFYSQKNIILKLSPFLLSPFINGFILHYFFSKPVMKLLHYRYPDYFPAFFDIQPGTYTEADGLKITVKKPRTTSWTLMLTLSLVNFHIFTSLFWILYYKN